MSYSHSRGIHLGEERLVLLQFLPFAPIVELALVYEIQIELARTDLFPVHGLEVGGKVTFVLQAVRDRTDPVGQTIIVFPVGTHVVGIGRGLVHTDEKGAPARGANRGG